MLLWEFSEVILPSRIISSRHTYLWIEAQESEDTPTPSHAIPGTCPQISPQIFPKANGQTLHRCPQNPPSCCRVGYLYPLLPTHIHPTDTQDTLQSLSHTPQPHRHPTGTTWTFAVTPSIHHKHLKIYPPNPCRHTSICLPQISLATLSRRHLLISPHNFPPRHSYPDRTPSVTL